MADKRAVLSYPSERINSTLDSIEERLPIVPRRLLQVNRAVAALGCSLATRAASALSDSGEVVTDAATTGAKTVSGQARSVVDRTMTTATNGVREVTGQARAQADQFVETLETEAGNLADDTETAVDDMAEASLAGWTRAELYERAQELDVDGRSGMNKAQLIDALTNESESSIAV